MTIQIHGNEYVTVAERVQEAHKELKEISITTEVLYQSPVVIKATVVTSKGIFTGISAANPAKAIEKQSPYEVAETSAIGRALGFAGFGIVEGIATADEIVKAEHPSQATTSQPQTSLGVCAKCGAPNKLSQAGKPYCSKLCWKNAELPSRQYDTIITAKDETPPMPTDEEIDISEIELPF